MSTVLRHKSDELAAKRRELHDLFAQYPDLDVPEGKSQQFVEEVRRRNDELDTLGQEVEQLRAVDEIERKNREAMASAERLHRPAPFAAGGPDAPQQAQSKSLGQMFIESKAFKEYQSGNGRGPLEMVDVETKTLFQESTGFTPQAIRTGVVVPSAQQMPRVIDVVPLGTTSMTAVVYMAETTFDNEAAETDEGGSYPEAALAYTEQSSPVRKIAVFLPVTDEQLADVTGMQDRINNRLTLMIRQRLDSQLINGDGSPPDLTGILNTGSVQTQARGTDPNVDAIYKALTKIRYTGFADPNAVLFHPNNWQAIRLLRTADGLYIYGNPSDPGVDRLWGLPVIQSTFVPENTAVAGDFQGYSELDFKAGLEFEVSNSHADYFTKGQLAIRCQLRAAFVIYRPAAFCYVTGLD